MPRHLSYKQIKSIVMKLSENPVWEKIVIEIAEGYLTKSKLQTARAKELTGPGEGSKMQIGLKRPSMEIQ